jgi:hypothetical protein
VAEALPKESRRTVVVRDEVRVIVITPPLGWGDVWGGSSRLDEERQLTRKSNQQ